MCFSDIEVRIQEILNKKINAVCPDSSGKMIRGHIKNFRSDMPGMKDTKVDIANQVIESKLKTQNGAAT